MVSPVGQSQPLALPDRVRDRANAIRAAFGQGFVALSRAGGFDPGLHWCGADLHGVDFGQEDLSGFLFIGANLHGANLSGARNVRLDMFLGAGFDRTTRWPAGWVAPIRAGALQVDPRIRRGDPDTALWMAENVTAWEDIWGRDTYGPYAIFSVPARAGARVSQCMRWCPPGRFLMGSPDTEVGRLSVEGPCHGVSLAEGFWMFETACREALWQAVTGAAAPSGRGDPFPVTDVSWDDAQAFIAQLNAARPDLALALPSEAQWEYACRAGTDTAYAFGDTITPRQACFSADGPVPVGSLSANPWGLREMHGNVWEWCADTWHEDYRGAPTDGSAWIADGAADRVVRGGSWLSGARNVRSAYRIHDAPAYRNDYRGFRCARVQ